MPKVRSYDVLGARFDGTSLNNDPVTSVYLDNVKKNITMSTVKKSNGFGVSFKLPTGGSSLKITQSCQHFGHLEDKCEHYKCFALLSKIPAKSFSTFHRFSGILYIG